MKFYIVLFLLLVLCSCMVLADISKGIISEGEYAHSKSLTDGLTLYYQYNATNEILEIAFEGTNINGMMGLCIGVLNSGMNDCDFLGAYVDGSDLHLRDGALVGIGSPPTQDVTSSIIASNHSVVSKSGDTVTTIKLQRALVRKETKIALKNEETRSSWAYTTSKSFTSGHSGSNSRGIVQMNLLLTGKDEGDDTTPFTLFPFHYVVLGSVAIMLCLVGVVITYIKAFQLTLPFQLLLFRPLLKYPLPHWSLKYTPAILLTMSLGELIVVFGYLTYIASAFAYTIANTFLTKSWISPGDPIARLIGELALFHISLLLCASSRYSIFFYIFGIPFDRAIRYHQVAGSMAFTCMFVHGLIMLIEYSVSPLGILYVLQWSDSGTFWVGAGPIAFLSFVFLVIFALPLVRRKLWEIFRIAHFVFFHIGIVFVFLHMKTKYFNYIYIGVPGLLYLTDMTLRFVNYLIPASIVELKAHEDLNITEITVRRKFLVTPRAGQFLFLYVPGVHPFQSHPFSIVNVPAYHGDKSLVRFMVKGIGGYTRSLLKYAAKKEHVSKLLVRLEGPYGAPALPVNFYQQFVFVAGGIGITPMISHMVEYMTANAATESTHVAHLIWVVRRTEFSALLRETLLSLYTIAGEKGHAHVDIYVTRGDTTVNLFEEELKEVDDAHPTPAPPLKKSPNVHLQVHEKRPDFKTVLKQARAYYTKVTNVSTFPPMGVMACGPPKMVHAVHQSCGSVDAFPSNIIHFQQHEFLF